MTVVKFKTNSGFRIIKVKPAPQKVEEQVKTGYIENAQSFFMQKGSVESTVPESRYKGSRYEPTEKYEKELMIGPGVAIPEVDAPHEKEFNEFVKEEQPQTTIEMKYPLIPKNPKQGEKIFAYAHIYWDPKTHELVYKVVEPQLDYKSQKLFEEIKAYIVEKVDIEFTQVKKKEATDYLSRIFDRALDYFRVPADIREVMNYFIFRDFIGMEKIEPLLSDRNLEDISCDGAGIPIFVYHRNPNIGSLKTNVIFQDINELDSFTNKLSERCGKVISVAKPLLDGTLPDGSRVQATLGSDIARQGSNFTIRLFTEKPLTPTDMIFFKTCDVRMLAYFWYLIEHGASILISGGTATGKTSFLNALSLFIKPQMKIVSIEDTAELRLPHPHWVPEVARTAIAETGGAVDMFELLRESLRQRPDYIIVGEVRGKEAYVLFQQMAVGHAGLSTIHAENFPKLVDRLTTAPISLSASLIENLDAIVFLKRVKKGNKYVRRVNGVMEVIGYDPKKNVPLVNSTFKWDSKDDKYISENKSKILKKIADSNGLTDQQISDELKKRAKVIDWMLSTNIKDYVQISKVLNLFYSNPDLLLNKIEVAA